MDDLMVFLTLSATAIIIIALLIGLCIGKLGNNKLEQLQRYWDVEIGMSEVEMLEIMGDGYNRSLLKNNRTKYEWRINSYSVGTSINKVSMRSYSGVKKVTIYVKNGLVEEVKPYNVD